MKRFATGPSHFSDTKRGTGFQQFITENIDTISMEEIEEWYNYATDAFDKINLGWAISQKRKQLKSLLKLWIDK